MSWTILLWSCYKKTAGKDFCFSGDLNFDAFSKNAIQTTTRCASIRTSHSLFQATRSTILLQANSKRKYPENQSNCVYFTFPTSEENKDTLFALQSCLKLHLYLFSVIGNNCLLDVQTRSMTGTNAQISKPSPLVAFLPVWTSSTLPCWDCHCGVGEQGHLACVLCFQSGGDWCCLCSPGSGACCAPLGVELCTPPAPGVWAGAGVADDPAPSWTWSVSAQSPHEWCTTESHTKSPRAFNWEKKVSPFQCSHVTNVPWQQSMFLKSDWFLQNNLHSSAKISVALGNQFGLSNLPNFFNWNLLNLSCVFHLKKSLANGKNCRKSRLSEDSFRFLPVYLATVDYDQLLCPGQKNPPDLLHSTLLQRHFSNFHEQCTTDCKIAIITAMKALTWVSCSEILWFLFQG